MTKMTRFLGGKWRAVVWRRCQNVACAIRFLARADAPGLFCSNRCNMVTKNARRTNGRSTAAAVGSAGR